MNISDVTKHFVEPMRVMFGDPPGDQPALALRDYAMALRGFSPKALEAAADRLKREAKRRTWPMIADCLDACRAVSAEQNVGTHKGGRRGLYTYRMPRSVCIERGITNDRARDLISQGIHPRGSIWLPGRHGSSKPEIGDLFGHDPDWPGAVSLPEWDGGSSSASMREAAE